MPAWGSDMRVMAGGDAVRWYQGDEPSIRVAFDDRMLALGQSVCALTPRQRFVRGS